MEKFIKNMKTFKKNKSTCITIPQEVLRLLDWKDLKELSISVDFGENEDSIVIRRQEF